MSKDGAANIGNHILFCPSIINEPMGRFDEPSSPAVKIQISEVVFGSPYSNWRFAPYEITPAKSQHNCFVSKTRDQFLEEVRSAKIVAFCNPDQPTGR